MKLMEKEGAIREEIIDMKLFDLALNRYHEIGKKTIFSDNFFIADPNSMVESLIQIKTKDTECYLASLDNCQVMTGNSLTNRFYSLMRIWKLWGTLLLLISIKLNMGTRQLSGNIELPNQMVLIILTKIMYKLTIQKKIEETQIKNQCNLSPLNLSKWLQFWEKDDEQWRASRQYRQNG